MDLSKKIAKQRFFECESKVRYDTEMEAKHSARRFRQRYYQCIWCRGYHLTSKRK